MAPERDLALPLLEQAQEVRERLGDERAVARVIGLRARALYTGRQHDESIALLRPAVERFAAMSDDPVGITLSAALAANLIRLGQYGEGLPLLDRSWQLPSEYGAADIAAEAMIGKGTRVRLPGPHVGGASAARRCPAAGRGDQPAGHRGVRKPEPLIRSRPR